MSMTASMSKRQQARNERELQHLIISVAGNDRCADCQARNPGWASWSLGIFLCMRCAAIHRKLGTHISKVKSLSMDTWSTDQVETMRQNGNTSVNKVYNPKNIKPGIPLDVDEVDSAMERFIRQKYQERSLADGKPRPPSRDAVIIPTRSPLPSPSIHIQPPKRVKIFGFKLRASSSAYPASKRETRNLPPLEPTVENAFQTEVRSNKPSKPRASNDSGKDRTHEDKLTSLREMGFLDDQKNSAVLERLSGDLSRTVESLIRLGEGSGPNSRKSTPIGSRTNTPLKSTFPDGVENKAGNDHTVSQNPFDQPNRANTLPVSQTRGQQAEFNNPSGVQSGGQSAHQSMDQAFQAMQISQPLFPHSTGGYPIQQPPVQDPRFQHSMTPPIPSISQQYAYTTSPPTMYSTNPFHQATQPQTLSIPESYAAAQQTAPFSAPLGNPFHNQHTSYEAAQPPLEPASLPSQRSYSNPFGIPPSPQSAPATFFDNQSTFTLANATQQSFHSQQDSGSQSQPLSQSLISPQQPTITYQQSPNICQPQSQTQKSPLYQSQASPMRPHLTGRLDKQSILALYNCHHLAPQPMPTIPDDPTSSGETAPPSMFSSSPQQTSSTNAITNIVVPPARRSATLPISTSPFANLTGAAGSKNPFLSGNNIGASRRNSTVASSAVAHPLPTANSIMHRHGSQESVSIANLESGRHSPDAFANLSARFVSGMNR